MSNRELNIIVCVDQRRCAYLRSNGRNGPEILEELKGAVEAHGLQDRVQVTHCGCIFGCTYGPRIDVAKRWSGEKALYGTMEGDVTISIRGRVEMLKIPAELLDLVLENLPEE